MLQSFRLQFHGAAVLLHKFRKHKLQQLRTKWQPAKNIPGRNHIDAAVIAAASIPITLAFRGAMRWLVGTSPSTHGGHILQLAALIALVIGALVFAVETVMRRHG